MSADQAGAAGAAQRRLRGDQQGHPRAERAEPKFKGCLPQQRAISPPSADLRETGQYRQGGTRKDVLFKDVQKVYNYQDPNVHQKSCYMASGTSTLVCAALKDNGNTATEGATDVMSDPHLHLEMPRSASRAPLKTNPHGWLCGRACFKSTGSSTTGLSGNYGSTARTS